MRFALGERIAERCLLRARFLPMKSAGMEREGETPPRGDSLQDKGRGVAKDRLRHDLFLLECVNAAQ